MHHNHCEHVEHESRCAPRCDDQTPVVSPIGRGLQGDSYRVELHDPNDAYHTYLEGIYHDEASGAETTDWISKNINGGELMDPTKYGLVHLRPWTNPQTYTIAWIYRRPDTKDGDKSWSFVTPAMTYTYDLSGSGPIADNVVGGGVATLFLRLTSQSTWTEKLIYPTVPGMTPQEVRDALNMPNQGEPWTVNLVFGIGGDVEVINIDDLAKALGVNALDLRSYILNNTPLNWIDGARNVSEALNNLRIHFHTDLGFNVSELAGDGGTKISDPTYYSTTVVAPQVPANLVRPDITIPLPANCNTVKEYIDALKEFDLDYTYGMGRSLKINYQTQIDSITSTINNYTQDITNLQNQINTINTTINNMTTKMNRFFTDILAKIHPGTSTFDATTGAITWAGDSAGSSRIPVGTLNLTGQYNNSGTASWIRCHATDTTNDLRAI